MNALAHALERLQAELERTASHGGEEAVHDVRVAVRRASEALRLTGRHMPKARRLRREIRAVRRDAASVRDRDIARRLLRRLGLPATDPALVYLAGQRDCAAGQLRDDLQRLLKKGRPARWQKWAAQAGQPEAALATAVTGLFSTGNAAAAAKDPAALHHLRIAAKRLRYTLEILNPKGGEPRLARLRSLQRQLGQLQDAVATQILLRQIPRLSPAGRRAAGELNRRVRACAEACSRTWLRRFGPRVEKGWDSWAREQAG